MKTLLIFIILVTNASRGATSDHIQFSSEGNCQAVLSDMRAKFAANLVYSECVVP